MTFTDPFTPGLTINGQRPTGSRAEQAEALRAAFAAQRAELYADTSPYNEAERQRRYLELRERTNAAIAQLAEAEQAEAEAERTKLERELLGPPALPLGASTTDQIVRDSSFRDARERARATEERPVDPARGLMALYRDAVLVGDTIQAKAAFVVAFDRADIDVLNAWSEDHPADEAKVDRLYELRAEEIGARRALVGAFLFGGV